MKLQKLFESRSYKAFKVGEYTVRITAESIDYASNTVVNLLVNGRVQQMIGSRPHYVDPSLLKNTVKAIYTRFKDIPLEIDFFPDGEFRGVKKRYNDQFYEITKKVIKAYSIYTANLDKGRNGKIDTQQELIDKDLEDYFDEF